MNALDSLRSLSNYPIPMVTLQDVMDSVGIGTGIELTQEMRTSKEFKRAQARIYFFLSEAPNVTQGGISYSFTDEDRRRFRLKAESILDELGEDGDDSILEYGYKGESL